MSIPPSLPDLTGLTLGTVTLLQKIGEGSMGVVYRGFQNTLSRPVAVKVVFRNRLNKLFTSERFRQEAEVVANDTVPRAHLTRVAGVQAAALRYVYVVDKAVHHAEQHENDCVALGEVEGSATRPSFPR